MDAAVDGIDDHPGAVGDLVDHADADDFADQWNLARLLLEQGHAGRSPVDADLLQRALHHLELVGAIAELAQLCLHLAIYRPDPLLTLLDQPEPLEGFEPADSERLLRRIALLDGGDDKDAVLGAGEQRPVEPG